MSSYPVGPEVALTTVATRGIGLAATIGPDAAFTEDIRDLLPRRAIIVGEIIDGLKLEDDMWPDDPVMEALLETCVRDSVSAGMQVFACGLDTTRTDPSSAALEYVGHLAHRGLPVAPLLRVYGLCQARLLDCVSDELHAGGSQPNQSMTPVLTIVRDIATFVSCAAEQIVAAYQIEREAWLGSKAAARQHWISELLGGEAPDIRRAEAALGYGMSGWHLAVETWIHGPVAADDVPSVFDKVGTLLRRFLGIKANCLAVPNDASSARMWFPLRRPVEVDAGEIAALLKNAHLPVRVAIGIPQEGHAGFRSSARTAARVKWLAARSPHSASSVLTFRSLAPVALLADDRPELSWFVKTTLGDLVLPDERHAVLRESLLVFLESGRNYQLTADRLFVHRNTVRYRIKQAVAALGRDPDEDGLALHLALLACRWHHFEDDE
jgi:hypothetical protein